MANVSMIDGHIDGAEQCVICGRDIPEDSQVCVICGKTEPRDMVEVRHGKWIDDVRTFSVMDKFGYVREEQKKTHTCSLCRIGIVGLDNMNFCPNCGAKMDGERRGKE